MKQTSHLLKEQLENLYIFKELLKEQQKCIITNNREGLADNLKKEEQIVFRIRDLQKEIDEKAIKKEPSLKSLYIEFRKELKIIVTLNAQNRVLVDQSRNFIKTLLTNLVLDNHNILDRRI